MPIIAGAALLAGVASGVMQAEAQRKAANKNADLVRETNALNYKQWQESRGLEGNALFPLYAPEGMEKQGLEDAFAYYQALGVTPPAELLKQYQDIVAREQPAIDASGRVIGDIFSGQMEREALAQAAPVAAARMEMARTGREGIEAARAAAEGALSAEEARKGYVGTGSFAQGRRLATTVPFYQQAAGAVAGANLQNALETAKIQEAARQLRVGSVNMPAQRAGQMLSLAQMPSQAVAGMAQLQQQPLNFWKMNYSPPPENAIYQTPVVESPFGAALGGVAQGLGGVAGAYQQQQTNDMWNNYMNSLAYQNRGMNPSDAAWLAKGKAQLGGM